MVTDIGKIDVLSFRQVAISLPPRRSAGFGGRGRINVTSTQPSPHQQGARADLGPQLFDRHSNGVTLTFDVRNSCSAPAP